MKKILETLFAATLLLMTVACGTDSDMAAGGSQSNPCPLSFFASDQGFTSTKNGSRVTDNEYTSTFEKGDQMGMYITDASGKVVVANMCLTYDGSSAWTPSSIYYYDSSTMSGYQFFAYFPYQSTAPSQLPAVGTTATTTDAATFFTDMTTAWATSLPADQTSKASFTGADLMISKGTLGSLTDGMFPITFTMTHAMAMVEMKLPYVVLSTDATYGYTQGLSITTPTTDAFPYHVKLGTYRYLVKPSTAITINGTYCQSQTADSRQSFTPAQIPASTSAGIGGAGTYYTLTVDGGTKATDAYTLKAGDYLLNDGSIVPYAATNSALLSCLSRAIGVVFTTTTSSTDKTAGYNNGYALALKNAATGKAWSSQATTKDLSTDLVNTVDLMEADLDGLTHCKDLVTNGGSLKSYTSDNYPALYYAMTFGTTNTAYAAPSKTSGWYLPSMGQWYQIYYNLCGVTTAATVSGSSTADYYGYWSDGATNAAANLNVYLSKAYTYNTTVETLDYVKTTAERWFWTSSEFSASWACDAIFSSDGGLILFRPTKSYTNTGNRVRAVLAF